MRLEIITFFLIIKGSSKKRVYSTDQGRDFFPLQIDLQITRNHTHAFCYMMTGYPYQPAFFTYFFYFFFKFIPFFK